MRNRALAKAITASQPEIKAVGAVARSLTSKKGKARLSGPDGQEMILPDSLYSVLSQAARALATGRGVQVLPIDAQLTTQGAADFLSVSRPFLIKQLEEGRLPFHRVGTHRRIKLVDLIVFKDALAARRVRALQHLVDDAQELGIYDE